MQMRDHISRIEKQINEKKITNETFAYRECTHAQQAQRDSIKDFEHDIPGGKAGQLVTPVCQSVTT
jgi:hypothetical protein